MYGQITIQYVGKQEPITYPQWTLVLIAKLCIKVYMLKYRPETNLSRTPYKTYSSCSWSINLYFYHFSFYNFCLFPEIRTIKSFQGKVELKGLNIIKAMTVVIIWDISCCHNISSRYSLKLPLAVRWFQRMLKVCSDEKITKMSQRTAKLTIRLMQPAKTQISLHIRTVWSVFTNCMCLLQPPDYQKRDKWEPKTHWVDVQADKRFCWLHRS